MTNDKAIEAVAVAFLNQILPEKISYEDILKLAKQLNSIEAAKAAIEAVTPIINQELRRAATELYMAGCWTLKGMPIYDQVRLWENLRDALGLPEGTATEKGVHNTSSEEGES